MRPAREIPALSGYGSSSSRGCVDYAQVRTKSRVRATVPSSKIDVWDRELPHGRLHDACRIALKNSSHGSAQPPKAGKPDSRNSNQVDYSAGSSPPTETAYEKSPHNCGYITSQTWAVAQRDNAVGSGGSPSQTRHRFEQPTRPSFVPRDNQLPSAINLSFVVRDRPDDLSDAATPSRSAWLVHETCRLEPRLRCMSCPIEARRIRPKSSRLASLAVLVTIRRCRTLSPAMGGMP
jgi:hypothetical protein